MDSFLENIELKRKVIIDYEFISFILDKANDDDINAITFIDYISKQDVEVYDFLGNNFDIRVIQHMQEELIRKDEIEPELSKVNAFSILAFKNNYESNLLVLTNENFESKWETLSKCKSISINKGEKFKSTENFWKNTLENYINIPYKFLIVQEPFYNSINTKSKSGRLNNKGENINTFINLISDNNSNKLILVDKKKSKLDNNDFIIQSIKEIDSNKYIHDRFFLTNYFFFRSGNSFDYFNSNNNEVQLSTSLVVTSIINDFSSFINFKQYYEIIN